ncbi:MAG: hypothetical protein BRC33_13445, partial [Cyanobacteria bacterium SW_9_44_58]
ERCEGKLSRTVLKSSGEGDLFTDFNPSGRRKRLASSQNQRLGRDLPLLRLTVQGIVWQSKRTRLLT